MEKDIHTQQDISPQTHKMLDHESSGRSKQENQLDTRLLSIAKELLPQYGSN